MKIEVESLYESMSKAERIVAKFLKKHGLLWYYQKPVFIWDEDNRPRVWTPDFYLVQYGLYIEVCGSEEFDYEYRSGIYESNGYNVIFLHLFKSPYKWKAYLFEYLEGLSEARNDILEKAIKKWKK